jgi:hypothetical protein
MALLRHVRWIEDPLSITTSSMLGWFGFESLAIFSGLVSLEVDNAVIGD